MKTLRTLFVFFAVLLCLAALPLAGQNAGTVFASSWDGAKWAVNANGAADPQQVYLAGGPHSAYSGGLPLGKYYYQVTDPSGTVLLSADDISCRTVQVVANAGTRGVLL